VGYKLTFGLDYWECGDGCCGGHNYTVLLDGKSVTSIGEDEESKKELVKDFVLLINRELDASQEVFHLSDSFILDESYDERDITKGVFLNNTLIKDGEYGGRTFLDILISIGKPIIYDTYYIDREDFFVKNEWNIVLQKRQEYNGQGESTIRYKSNW